MIKSRQQAGNSSFAQECKKRNLKITPQRSAIYEELCKSSDHPNAEVMLKRVRKVFPNISFDTVNRTLLTFARIGIADVVEGHGDPKRFDPNTGTHHHFKCVKCGNIIDFYDSAYDRIEVSKAIRRGFTVLKKKVVLEGICGKCLGNSR